MLDKVKTVGLEMDAGVSMDADVDIDLREVYFLIMHFLSAGPCKRTYGQFWNELLEHQLLPRRYHAWYSRTGERSGDEDDDGVSLPISYLKLVERYPHIEKDHLVKLLKQLLVGSSSQPHSIVSGALPTAADVPTLLGSGSFSLVGSGRDREDMRASQVPGYLRWPHIQADQVRGLSLREIGGGFPKHHRAPSVRAACYAIAKPSTLVQKMQIIKKLRGHQNAVYCAMYDRSGRYVITGSDDRLVKIWSMETAFCLASCRGHEGDITDLAVSSNNVMVASSSNDFIIRVWHLPDGRPISVLRGHTGVVTAIAFSPRPNAAYQLLSSSDDGTCRIWDARNSQLSPRIFTPKPPEAVTVAGNSNGPPSASISQQSRQILCCAFNANGTVFVTGSADTYARVWNVWKNNIEDPEQPNHELDLLSGHENDVNYVQFSGCAVASRSSTADHFKEDNLPKFKNSWFTHDNIVTCSRDGSAIIWIPRSRRSHGKVGRWIRSYHLKVPPPPMPPQPPRGGPRQRSQPIPRGVNMIMWSLDNRFVLAAIMDCRICIWNASDGSLVHSLMGHSESTFVLDVHPFNPRIAMSAGYDGKTIIWDIWEGTPVQIYETGRFKLVDGKFSPDGTSIVVSDEVGQIFIIATGQGESQKDAKYDQFFLGDYRPMIQDTNGNVLDQESQLTTYRRNIQDLLCDSSMIPYPESYQNMYQKRRLGALGYEWNPPSVKFAVGPTYNSNTGEYQTLPIIDLDRWVEPMPVFMDAIDWEQEYEVQSEDTDSEYNVTDEYSSEGEHVTLHGTSSEDSECSAEDSGVDHSSKEGLRRSERKKHKSKAELTTSSGRRVKRRNLDECDGATARRTHRKLRRKKGRSSSRKSMTSKSLRPQRRAARNALNLFSKITSDSTDGEDEDDSESCSSESELTIPESNSQSIESEQSMQRNQVKRVRESVASRDEYEGFVQDQMVEAQANGASRRKLVLKLPRRDSKANDSLGNGQPECSQQGGKTDFLARASLTTDNLDCIQSNPIEGEAVNAMFSQNGFGGKTGETLHGETSNRPVLPSSCSGNAIRWGEVKVRTAKRMRLGDSSPKIDGPDLTRNDINGRSRYEDGNQTSSNSANYTQGDNLETKKYIKDEPVVDGSLRGLDGTRCKKLSPDRIGGSLELERSSPNQDEPDQVSSPVHCNGDITETISNMDRAYICSPGNNKLRPQKGFEGARDNKNSSLLKGENYSAYREEEKNVQPSFIKLRIKQNGLVNEASRNSNTKSFTVKGCRSLELDLHSRSSSLTEQNLASVVLEYDKGTNGQSSQNCLLNNSESHSLDTCADKPVNLSRSHDLKKPDQDSGKMYNAVYKRSRSSKNRKYSEDGIHSTEEGQPSSSNHSVDIKMNYDDVSVTDGRRTRSMGTKATTNESNFIRGNVIPKECYGSIEASTSGGNSGINARQRLLCDDWKSTSGMTVGLRSARNRRESNNVSLQPVDKRTCNQPLKKVSWLMLLEHEASYRYIPQRGDDVAYLRQGHEEYINHSGLQLEAGPWRSVNKNLKAVEFCKVCDLDYSALPGSGESCCKLTLEFIDPSSCGFGRTFVLTLPELVSFSDFIVERTRYDYAIERNWTTRDKCQVWWRSEDEEGGSWWEGRIVSVKPKSSEYTDSPWERYTIRYKDDSHDHLHCPWEFHEADCQWEHPRIYEKSRDKLLSCLARIEQTSIRNQDNYGIQKLNQEALQSSFINRFPVHLSPEVIKRRLENNYYRNLEAVKHDAEVMLSNAESFYGKRTEMAPKLRRLSDWIERTFSAL